MIALHKQSIICTDLYSFLRSSLKDCLKALVQRISKDFRQTTCIKQAIIYSYLGKILAFLIATHTQSMPQFLLIAYVACLEMYDIDQSFARMIVANSLS